MNNPQTKDHLRLLYFQPMKIQFTTQVFREGKTHIAYAPELDVSSCATTEAKARKNLVEAVRLFLEEAEKKGSFDQNLQLLDQINDACENAPDASDHKRLSNMRHHHRNALEGTW